MEKDYVVYKGVRMTEQEAEARINDAYAKKAGVTPMRERPEFKDFGKEKPTGQKK